MARVRLIHWKPDEGEARAAALRDAGHEVEFEPFGPATLRAVRSDPPEAVVIDLSRLPAQGRDVAFALRTAKSTREVPILFLEGDPAKVERVRSALPDANFDEWRRVRSALRKAIAQTPRSPIVPASNLAGYSDTPLLKKLGIKAGMTVTLAGAPAGFERTLGSLPDGVTLRRQARGRCGLALWFVKSRSELTRRIERMAAYPEGGNLWIVWPKQSSALASDLTQADVRRTGLAAGLVDYKVCSVDETWSGLRFTCRKK